MSDSERAPSMLTTRRVAYVLASFALLGVGYMVGLLTGPEVYHWLHEWGNARAEARYVKRPAPDFRAVTVDGATWDLSKQRGKVVILDFTASWCMPCVGAYPLLKSVYYSHHSGGQLSVLSVALDDNAEVVRKYVATYDLPWPVTNESGKKFDNSIARRYEITAIPSIWIIDQKGRVVAMNAWGDQIERTVDELLRQTG